MWRVLLVCDHASYVCMLCVAVFLCYVVLASVKCVYINIYMCVGRGDG
jgi:hypothetical protein